MICAQALTVGRRVWVTRAAAGPVHPDPIVLRALCYRRLVRRERMEKIHGSRTRPARRPVPRATIVPRTALRPCRAKARWRRRKASPGGRSVRLVWEPRKRHEQATTLLAAWKARGRGKRRASRATAATSACGMRARRARTNLRRAWRRPRSTRRSARPVRRGTTARARPAPRFPAPREPMGTSLATRLDSPTPRARARAIAATTARKAPCCRLRVLLERLATRPDSRRRRARRLASRTRRGNVARLSVRKGTTVPPVRRTAASASAARACTARAGPVRPSSPTKVWSASRAAARRRDQGKRTARTAARTACRRAPRRGGSCMRRTTPESCVNASVMKHSSRHVYPGLYRVSD